MLVTLLKSLKRPSLKSIKWTRQGRPGRSVASRLGRCSESPEFEVWRKHEWTLERKAALWMCARRVQASPSAVTGTVMLQPQAPRPSASSLNWVGFRALSCCWRRRSQEPRSLEGRSSLWVRSTSETLRMSSCGWERFSVQASACTDGVCLYGAPGENKSDMRRIRKVREWM